MVMASKYRVMASKREVTASICRVMASKCRVMASKFKIGYLFAYYVFSSTIVIIELHVHTRS